jgi:hypothetical protein
MHPSHDVLKLGGVGGGSRVKLDATLLVPREDPVEKGDVKMKIEVEAAAESLQKADGSDLRTLERRPRAGAGGDGLDEDPDEGAEHVLLERGKPSQLVRE